LDRLIKNQKKKGDKMKNANEKSKRNRTDELSGGKRNKPISCVEG
jgi:hypothetical protein